MSRLIYSFMVSLDGYVEGPNRELDWPLIDEELHTFINDQQSEIGAELYGRRLYELMAGYWPTADLDPTNPPFVIEFAQIWKRMEKIVFSRSLERVEGNARLVRTDAIEEIKRLKGQPGKDLAIGGPTLAAAALQQGLIDEYQLFVHPVILGGGTPMFPALERPIKLRLVERHQFGSGVVYLRYLYANPVIKSGQLA
jgi:dihydrofolate reductase